MFPDAGIGDLASGGNEIWTAARATTPLRRHARHLGLLPRQTRPGRGGDDTLVGRGGDDILVGDADRLSPLSSGGNDRLFGGAGNDALYGDTRFGDNGRGGNDELFGGAGDDFLAGGSGNNRIDGGSGVEHRQLRWAACRLPDRAEQRGLRRDQDRVGRYRPGDERRVPSIRRRGPQHLAESSELGKGLARANLTADQPLDKVSFEDEMNKLVGQGSA